jgi:4'-phosphopantetheinyl transferase EntD
LEPALQPRICLPADMAAFGDTAGVSDLAGKLTFSAKESAYKCLWPSTRRFMDFKELILLPGEQPQKFRIQAVADELAPLATRVQGAWLAYGDVLLTLCWQTPPEPGETCQSVT